MVFFKYFYLRQLTFNRNHPKNLVGRLMTEIIFSSKISGEAKIYVMTVDGEYARRLTQSTKGIKEINPTGLVTFNGDILNKMIKFFYNNRSKFFLFLLAFLSGWLLFSCASAESQIGRIRALEKRVSQLESQERQSNQFKTFSKQFKRSLLLISQQLDGINIDRGKNVQDLEIIKQNLKKLEIEFRLVKLQLQKIENK